MSLDYNVQAVADAESICYTESGRIKPELEALIFSTLSIGLDKITDRNISEWVHRIGILKRVDLGWFGYKAAKDAEPIAWYPDEATLRKYIGLGTNAGKITRLAFWKKVMKQLDEEVTPQVVC